MKFLAPALLGLCCAVALQAQNGQSPTTGVPGTNNVPSIFPPESSFRKVVLDGLGAPEGLGSENVDRPMEMAIASDGRVFYVEGAGLVKMYKPDTRKTTVIGNIPVFFNRAGGFEDGLLGITLDPSSARTAGFTSTIRSPKPRPTPRVASTGTSASPDSLSKATNWIWPANPR